MTKKILIVEDEPKMSEVMSLYLQQAGFTTKVFAEGLSVVANVRQSPPSLILLDLNLPGKDGIEICREIRSFSRVPIIMVTARVEEIDRLIGLELGADDYVCKPFSPRELVARVKANLRRGNEPIDASPDAHDIEMDDLRHLAHLDGQKLDLTPVEFRILSALLSPVGSVWSRDKLLNRMYTDGRMVSERTVDTHITNLRRKLQCVRAESECIHAIYSIGYKLEL